MIYDDLISTIDKCPICDKRMQPEKLNFNDELFVILLSCFVNHFHYESYACTINCDDVVIDTISIHSDNYHILWYNDSKKICLRDSASEIIIEKEFNHKTSMDWIQNPYKNILFRAKSWILLK